MAKAEPVRGTWPTVRLTVSPELLAAIEDRRQAGETIQTRINIILAEACGMVPQIRPRGNPIGTPGKRVKKPLGDK